MEMMIDKTRPAEIDTEEEESTRPVYGYNNWSVTSYFI
jgi:hypothetical protein